MSMSVTPVYAGLVALVFVFLSFRVIQIRQKARIGLGDGGNRLLMRRQRVHANFAEYAPLVIVLMALSELSGHPGWTLHLIGVCLIAGRLVHAYGVSQEPEVIRLRVIGMVLTLTALISGALANLGLSGLLS